MAKACPKNYTEYVARTKKIIDKWLSELKPDDQISAIQVLHSKLQTKSPEQASVFRDIVSQKYPDYIADNAFEDTLDLSSTPEHIRELDPSEFIDEIDEIDRQYDTGLDQEDKDNNAKDQWKKTKISEVVIGNAGFGIFKPMFINAIGERVSASEYAHILDKILPKADTFEKFESAIDRKYEGYRGTDSQRRNLVAMYNGAKPINKMKSEDKETLMWTNLDRSIADIYDAIVPRWQKQFQHLKAIDLKTKTQEPDRTNTNFIDVSTAEVFGENLNDITVYVPLSKMVNVIKKKQKDNLSDPGWFAKDANLDIGVEQFHKWNLELANRTKIVNGKKRSMPHVIVGINSGDPATLLISQISDEIFKKLLPREVVKDIIAANAIPESTAKYLEKNNYSLFYALRDARHILRKANVGPNVATKTKRSIAAQMMEVRYNEMLSIADALSKKGYIEYFAKEFDDGNIEEAQYNTFIENIANIPLNPEGEHYLPYHQYLAGIIAAHEWMKAARYNTYAIHDDARKTFDRLRLNKSGGVVLVGNGPTNHFIYDQNKVDIFYNDNKIDHFEDIPGLGITNTTDGATWASTDHLDRASEVSGRYPINTFESKVRQLKTVVVDRSDDGNSYIEKKHAVFKAVPNIEIKNKRGDTILWVAEELGQVRIFGRDADGNILTIDEVSDLDAVKTSVGKWDIQGNKLTHYIGETPEESTRVTILPSVVGHTTSTGPRQWMVNLNIDGLNKSDQEVMNRLKKLFEDHMLSEMDKHLNLLIDAFEDPNTMRSITKRKWAQEYDVQDNLQNMLGAINGVGIQHPNFLSQLRPMLNNMLLKNGALQFRTFENLATGKRQPIVGTYGTLVPDIAKEVKDGEFKASADLQVVKDYVERTVIAADAEEGVKAGFDRNVAIKGAWQKYRELDFQERADYLNEALESGKIKVSAINWRTPILSLGSLGVDDMSGLVPDGGDGLWFTAENVSKTKVGDYDIDHSHINIVPQDLANEIKGLFNTRYFKEQKDVTANLDLFKSLPSASMADYNGKIRDAYVQIKGSNAQGITTNMKNITTILSYKFGDITLTDGTIVRAKSPSELTVMDYAPLSQERSIKEIEKNLPPFASVVEGKDGEWYLKTTVEHEMTLIVNAATDHSKKGLLVNMWEYNGRDWIIPRMFKVIKGSKEFSPAHIKTLDALRKMFNFSRLMNGEKYDGRPMNMETIFFHSNKWLEFMEASNEDKLEAIKGLTNKQKIITISGQKVKTEVGIKNIDIKENRDTNVEKLIVRPAQIMAERYGENAPKYPGYIDPDEYKIIHNLAVKDLSADVINNMDLYNITNAVMDAADGFINKFAERFYKMFYNLKNEKGEYEGAVSIAKAQFDEDLWQFVKQAESTLKGLIGVHGKGVAVIATVRFAEGLGGRKNIRHFPPVEVMDSETLEKFMGYWEKYRNDDAVRKDFSKLEEIARSTPNIIKRIKREVDC